MKRWTPVPPVGDRKFWDRIAGTEYGKMMLLEAENTLLLPFPEPTEELYINSFVTRDRAKYEAEYLGLKKQLTNLAIGALIAPKTEFIARFSRLLQCLIGLKSWVLPAHDRYPHTTIAQANIKGLSVTNDLVSLDNAAGFTMAVTALEELLDAELVAAFRKETARKVLTPLALIARNRRPYNYWMILKHNWNAVCYCNTILTFLVADVPEYERELVIKFALEHVKYFLSGFNADGYCQEGPGYFGYGFGHYTYLAWALYEASGHKMNLFANERVQQIAGFPEKMMLSETQLPLFCDCHPKIFIRRDLMEIRDYLIGKTDGVNFLPPRMKESGRPQDLNLSQQLMLIGFSKSEKLRKITLNPTDAFPETGVFVWRGEDFAFCIKGGNNREFHNHNDVGSYVLVHKDIPLLLDPGQPRYNMDSFHSGSAYQNKLRSSYGHPVPVCNGELQLFGLKSKGVVLEHSDRGAVLDVTAPYRDTPAKQIVRSIDVDRKKKEIVVTDSAEFLEKSTFAVPLITFGKWEEIEPGMLRIFRDGEWEFFCKVEAAGEYEISDELIDEDILFDEPVRRILFSFKEKAKDFKISTTFILEK